MSHSACLEILAAWVTSFLTVRLCLIYNRNRPTGRFSYRSINHVDCHNKEKSMTRKHADHAEIQFPTLVATLLEITDSSIQPANPGICIQKVQHRKIMHYNIQQLKGYRVGSQEASNQDLRQGTVDSGRPQFLCGQAARYRLPFHSGALSAIN